MCGLAGFAGLPKGEATKLFLTHALGVAIDSRGEQGCGFISIKDKEIHTAKTSGGWSKAPNEFLLDAASSDMLVLHSRWATCGIRDSVRQAHPYTIKRKGKTVLYGAHNGIIYNAFENAKANKRKIEVDSQELFHLLVDNELEQMQSLNGYGVILYVKANEPHINLARLSEDGEIKVVELETGGYVWASTWGILSHGLKAAGLKAKWDINVSEVGRVFEIHPDKMVASHLDGVRLANPWTQSLMDKSWDQILMEQYDWDEEIESERKKSK